MEDTQDSCLAQQQPNIHHRPSLPASVKRPIGRHARPAAQPGTGTPTVCRTPAQLWGTGTDTDTETDTDTRTHTHLQHAQCPALERVIKPRLAAYRHNVADVVDVLRIPAAGTATQGTARQVTHSHAWSFTSWCQANCAAMGTCAALSSHLQAVSITQLTGADMCHVTVWQGLTKCCCNTHHTPVWGDVH